jgi:hypothetical protein
MMLEKTIAKYSIRRLLKAKLSQADRRAKRLNPKPCQRRAVRGQLERRRATGVSFETFLAVVHRVIVARLAVFDRPFARRRFIRFRAHFKPLDCEDREIGRLGAVLFTDRKMPAIVARAKPHLFARYFGEQAFSVLRLWRVPC